MDVIDQQVCDRNNYKWCKLSDVLHMFFKYGNFANSNEYGYGSYLLIIYYVEFE
jgi:hypothetical protein